MAFVRIDSALKCRLLNKKFTLIAVKENLTSY